VAAVDRTEDSDRRRLEVAVGLVGPVEFQKLVDRGAEIDRALLCGALERNDLAHGLRSRM
jgi:hypothetical protein